ncbi:twin arginine-targeting protein translocase TatC [Arachidicoccus ginsenosidimutans]|uniref:twin-arginine translocase subunit TatC n=1 Tax=Arachidicoccus sp. BS20 TaxID=1850526 RepID=UPI0007F172D7|nr:twin-arginine translocase subunit TatC [Arachidicoccus sp. BS20]ANI88994.1 twin arginine-targeting protein translocase TatC [Arachidicoccus sp. BS20]
MLQRFLRNRSSNPDAEMPFVDHLEALRWHIIRSALAILVLAVVVFSFHNWVFAKVIAGPVNPDFISYRMFCKLSQITHIKSLCMTPVRVEMQSTTFGGQFLGTFTIAFVGAFIAAFPYIFWEFWKFTKPALKDGELKNTRFAIFWVSFFFFLGAAFGYFVLAPFTFNFLAGFQISSDLSIMVTHPTLHDYLSNLTDIILGCGVAFELPVMAYILTRVGIITPKFLTSKRRYAVVILLIIAAFITPSPDWISQMIVFIPLMTLYEIGVAVSKRAAKNMVEKEKEEWS